MDSRYKDGDELPLITPGRVLFEEFMQPYNLSINELARQLKVAPTAISEIVRCRRAISTAMAARLGRFFQNSMQMWLSLQQSYEIEEFNRTHEPTTIAAQVTPFNYVDLETPKTDSLVSENMNKVAFQKAQTKKLVASKVQAPSRSTLKTSTKKVVAASRKKTKATSRKPLKKG